MTRKLIHLCSNRFLCKYDCDGKGEGVHQLGWSSQSKHICCRTDVEVWEVYKPDFKIELSEDLFEL